MAEFQPALGLVLRHEGGLEQDANYDQGLATKYGISLVFYRKNIKPNATDDDIKNLTLDDAKQIYRQYFWDKRPYADLSSQKIANRIFDLAVNCGVRQSGILLQKAANKCGASVVVDGIIGGATVGAINGLAEDVVYPALIDVAASYYEDIAKFAHNNTFLAGWLSRLRDTP